jgi:hypothetical protein
MVTHWDDIAPRVVDVGDLRARSRDLGRAAGSRRLGMRRRDIAPGGRFYPRSGKVAIRGLKAVFRVQQLDYWDGEA